MNLPRPAHLKITVILTGPLIAAMCLKFLKQGSRRCTKLMAVDVRMIRSSLTEAGEGKVGRILSTTTTEYLGKDSYDNSGTAHSFHMYPYRMQAVSLDPVDTYS